MTKFIMDVFLSSLPPAPRDHLMREAVCDYNARLENISDGSNVIYVDLYSAFADKDGLLPVEYGRSNVRLSPEGYAVIGRILNKFMK